MAHLQASPVEPKSTFQQELTDEITKPITFSFIAQPILLFEHVKKLNKHVA